MGIDTYMKKFLDRTDSDNTKVQTIESTNPVINEKNNDSDEDFLFNTLGQLYSDVTETKTDKHHSVNSHSVKTEKIKHKDKKSKKEKKLKRGRNIEEEVAYYKNKKKKVKTEKTEKPEKEKPEEEKPGKEKPGKEKLGKEKLGKEKLGKEKPEKIDKIVTIPQDVTLVPIKSEKKELNIHETNFPYDIFKNESDVSNTNNDMLEDVKMDDLFTNDEPIDIENHKRHDLITSENRIRILLNYINVKRSTQSTKTLIARLFRQVAIPVILGGIRVANIKKRDKVLVEDIVYYLLNFRNLALFSIKDRMKF